MDGSIQSVQAMGDLAMDRMAAASMAAKKSSAKMSMEKIDKTANDFEGVFLSQMLQPMFQSVGVNSMFGGGHGEEIMRSMMVQEYGKMMAQRGNFGIAEAVKKEMIKAQTAAYEKTSKTGVVHDIAQ